MKIIPTALIYLFAAWVLPLFLFSCSELGPANDVLVVTPTTGYPFESSEAGVRAIARLGEERDFDVTTTSDLGLIHEDTLRSFKAVVFLNARGAQLDYQQRAHLERFVQAGGGFIGIHAAIEGAADWPWYQAMIGAGHAGYLTESFEVEKSTLTIVDIAHPSTGDLPDSWAPADKWLKVADLSTQAHPLVRFASSEAQPVSWYHAFDGGRVFYTGMGHTAKIFSDENFLRHLAGGIEYALGDRAPLDYAQARTTRIPAENRFNRIVLVDNLDEPTELEVLSDGKVLFTQRKGGLMLYDPETDGLAEAGRIDVNTTFEDGLMGLALDPDFEQNHWIYLYYSPPNEEPMVEVRANRDQDHYARSYTSIGTPMREDWIQRLSRFEFKNDALDLESEVVLLEVPVQRVECCHTGGSIEFGPEGHLFLSTGDDTNPFASNGFGPIDERPGREPWDGQWGPANTNDLRGKILRILPQPDGSYTIPEGNLFPEGTEGARPEIYVMGNRNPYRISIDPKTGYLYWGEVGPDAREDTPRRGPRGHDEINQAREAGYFGWPYFVGNNKPYNDYNFATEESGAPFDPEQPVNDSPNNTGLRELPPAQEAFIWYPYDESPEFPIVGTGGRNAMAGPVFYSDLFEPGPHTFPDLFDGRLFIYDWIRGWILVVTMDENGDLQRIDPFLPTVEFHAPIDMQFDRNGVMYVLEYGKGWFSQNPDARITRVEYNPGNLAPDVALAADRPAGAAPLTVLFSAEETTDYENDDLSYAWYFENEEMPDATGARVSHTFDTPGVYSTRLIVSDQGGNVVDRSVVIQVGNEPPSVELTLDGNQTFFWENIAKEYSVRVTDAEDGSLEDGSIRSDDVIVQLNYLPEGYDKTLIAQGHQMTDDAMTFLSGQRIMESSDCSACHQIDRASIGPTYTAVADRYKDDEDAEDYLKQKIKNGGGGVWGETAMAAHPQLTEAELSAIVEYILSLADNETVEGNLGTEGTLTMTDHLETDSNEGMYFLRAVYTDRGSEGAGPLTHHAMMVLRHPRIQAESYDVANNVGVARDGVLHELYKGSYIGFEGIDMTSIRSLTFAVQAVEGVYAGGEIEVRLDSPDGDRIGSMTVQAGEVTPEGETFKASIEPTQGVHDVYFVLRDRSESFHPLLGLDWIYFGR